MIRVNAVLGGLAIYYMSSHLLPKIVIEALDARMRDFHWTGEEKCSGSQCLIKWGKLRVSTDCGGLGLETP